MTNEEFHKHMTYVSICTQTDLAKPTLAVYWEKFRDWPAEDFAAAMTWLADNHKGRFPTISQIRDARPAKRDTITEIDLANNMPLIEVTETEEERGSSELEAHIDAMTDDDLRLLFGSMFDGDKADQAIAFTIKQFRKNPKGRLYRSVIRDLVTNNSGEFDGPNYRCLICRDRGTVYCYDPAYYDEFKYGTFTISGHLRETTFACSCDKGANHRKPRDQERGKHTFSPLKTYDPARHCKVDALGVDSQVEELKQFVAEMKPPGYEEAFANYE